MDISIVKNVGKKQNGINLKCRKPCSINEKRRYYHDSVPSGGHRRAAAYPGKRLAGISAPAAGAAQD